MDIVDVILIQSFILLILAMFSAMFAFVPDNVRKTLAQKIMAVICCVSIILSVLGFLASPWISFIIN